MNGNGKILHNIQNWPHVALQIHTWISKSNTFSLDVQLEGI
jgi:hypothetical protein